MKPGKLILLVAIVVAVALFFVLDLGRYLDLAYLKSQRQALDAWYQDNPLLVGGGYFVVYVAVTGLSLPGAAILTLFGGALFGLATAVLLVSFASSIGATAAFLVSRYLLREAVQNKFGGKLGAINAGVEKDGAFYLFALRLVPAFPFFVINLLMGLTPIKTWTFYWVSQLGMLAGTVVYVYAGTQLGQIQSLDGILSPQLIFAFALLGVFPLIARKALDMVKARRVYRGWNKPARFDTNMVVIGAGSAGLVSAYIAAAIKAKVTLVEQHRMGGDCLNTGCVPSKALIRSAKFLSHAKRSSEFGIARAEVEFDFGAVMERVQAKINQVAPHDSVERYQGLGVDCVQGHAVVTSPWCVEVDGKPITTRSIVIAAGAEPFVPNIPGMENIRHYNSDTIWQIRELPPRLVVIGGGPIGCELAQAFRRFGSEVTQIQHAPRLLPNEDADVAEVIARRFADEGIEVRVDHTTVRFDGGADGNVLVCRPNQGGAEARIEFDAALFATGRKARVEGYGLDKLGIGLGPKNTIDTNEFLQTKYPNIYACGDVAGPYQFTHTASHQAWYAAVNALLGFKKFKADYSAIPWCTFTDPEVAHVGLSEQEATRREIPYEVTRYGLDDLDRAITDSEEHGFVKVLTTPGKDRILGATIVGEHAGDIISEFILAKRHGLGLNKILGTIHIYPTFAEANKYAAGNWKRAHAPAAALRFAERLHRYRRG